MPHTTTENLRITELTAQVAELRAQVAKLQSTNDYLLSVLYFRSITHGGPNTLRMAAAAMAEISRHLLAADLSEMACKMQAAIKCIEDGTF